MATTKCDNYANEAGVGAPNFPFGLTLGTGASFTPVLTDGTNTLNGVGYYEVHGDAVIGYIDFSSFTITSWGTSTDVTITGMPYAAKSIQYHLIAGIRINTTSSGVIRAAQSAGATTIALSEQQDAGVGINLNQLANFTVSASFLRVSFSYIK